MDQPDICDCMVGAVDCLEWMRRQPDNSVDLVFGSPPYEDCRTYGIEFALKGEDWVRWMAERTIEAVRISRGAVLFVVAGKTEKYRWSATPALLLADLHRAGINLRNPPIFHRVGIPGSGGPDWFRSDYEWIISASKPGKFPWSDNKAMGHVPKYAPGGAMSHRLTDGTRRNQWGGTQKRMTRERKRDGSRAAEAARPSHESTTVAEAVATGYVPPKKANPGNVVHCKVGGGLMGSKLAHENEAPFPEALAEFFIRSLCPPGGIVYDPFCGSGTALAVAVRNGRYGVGTDIRQDQVDLTLRRIEETKRKVAESVNDSHGGNR